MRFQYFCILVRYGDFVKFEDLQEFREIVHEYLASVGLQGECLDEGAEWHPPMTECHADPQEAGALPVAHRRENATVIVPIHQAQKQRHLRSTDLIDIHLRITYHLQPPKADKKCGFFVKFRTP